MELNRDQLAIEEYRALRATIRERGTARLFVVALTFVAWGGLMMLGWPAIVNFPPTVLISLLVLAAGFECTYAAHISTERIGRYIHAEFERPESLPRWEHAIMAFSNSTTAVPVDPLCRTYFLCALAVNALPMALAAAGPSFRGPALALPVLVGLAHGLQALRILRASAFARNQRTHDSAVFRGASR